MQILNTLVKLHYHNQSTILKQWLQKNHDTKMVQLYYGIAKDKLKSDIQASQFLYQETNHPNYRRLKNLLKEKLVELMLFIPISKEELNCTELKNTRDAFLKALFKQKVENSEALLGEVDLILSAN